MNEPYIPNPRYEITLPDVQLLMSARYLKRKVAK